MGDPHNKERYGETWNFGNVSALSSEIKKLPKNVVVSGGCAWCIMSPTHYEYKHAHDLKDIDLFISPSEFVETMDSLCNLGYQREKTKYDKLSPFYRFVKYADWGGKKVIIDLFLEDVPKVKVDGRYVVEPTYLLSLYGKHDPDSRLHGSGQCWSVQIAQELLDNGDSPIKHPSMGDFTRWISTGKQ